MKNYKQTVEAKKNFRSELLDIWLDYNGGSRITRQELKDLWGRSDRAVRKEINRIANYFAIISVSSRKGYELVITPHLVQNNPLVLKTQLDDIEHCLREFESRKEEINARMKPLIACKEVIIRYLKNWGMEEVNS